MRNSLAIACLLPAALLGCATAADAPVTSLEGTRWVAAEGEANRRPRIEFLGGGRVSGYTGCNMMNGTWRLEAGTVRFGALAMTKRLCAGPEGEVEKRLVAALGADSIGRRDGNRLIITAPGGARFDLQGE